MLLQLAVNKRRRREKSRIDRMTKCGVTKRRKAGRRTSRVKNGTAHNKIVTWRPASQEVAAEKSPKRQWGLPIAGNGSMCAEQLADYRAACDGKITWSAYFAKWGPRL